ncbi:MAG: tetratricopeptide repeat protein [Gracilimonas sp.]|uniref:tetratricopeptide repeat protein n=1 Tax=Gracilimonas sp. TaxID=1974203 RepID=UPI0019BBE230|nr:tetratricopeptide repeat protein [Gracilimonas sp.]MBD3615461.1 tetratricopeptide repeat protein [Gracilimonas sp.]
MGDQTCRSCHENEWKAWQGSHHDYAIGEANEEMVRGDFEDVSFRDGDDTYRFFREGEKYMVEAPGPEGEPEIYEVVYTFGWEPLQQYLVDFGKGKYQALHAAWDTEQNRWFSLYPDELIEPGEWLHWTGQSMNWNTMCADCHSTNLKQNYIAEADSFNTTWDVINVSCEACHGPGSEHVEFMNSNEADDATPERIRKDLSLAQNTSQLEEINTCAPCHSRREKLTDDYVHGNNFLDHFDPALPHPENYFADGQIRDEVYVYGSFLQSKMYTNQVQCTDCHDPHTLQLKESITDNKLCMNCHEPSYNSRQHHFHEENTEASQCVSCHMTGQTYMGNDYRRDHSFRIPRPDLSEELNTPNACNNCHSDQPTNWTARAIENWYGSGYENNAPKILAKAGSGAATPNELQQWINDPSQPEIIRATLVWYVGQFPGPQSNVMLIQALESKQPLIRAAAAKAIHNLPDDVGRTLQQKALRDSIRAVRLPAARELAGLTENDFQPPQRDLLNRAIREYKTYLDVTQYFPQGQMNRGQFYEQQEEIEKAIEAYQKALEKDPGFNPARMNLAYLYNSRGNNARTEQLLRTVIEQEPKFGQAHYSLGLLLAEQNQLSKAVQYFEQAARLLPEYSRIFYNWAIALQTLNRPDEAESKYQQAINLEPENSDYRYGIVTLYMQQEQYERAMEHAAKLEELHPGNPQVQQLLQTIEQYMN